MNTVRAAMGLLTRLPMRRPLVDASGAAAFPLVGGLIGAIGGLACLAIAAAAEPTLGAIVAIGVMALVSGGLHLDGLADTADALMAPDADRAEAARRDPATGTGGVVALIVVIGAQVAALASVAGTSGGGGGPVVAAATCLAVGATSRLVPIAGAWLWRRRARRDGFGAWFIGRLRPLEVAAALAIAVLAVAVAAGLTGSVALLAGTSGGALAGLAILGWISWRRDGLDGDALGASVELTVAVSLGLVAVLA